MSAPASDALLGDLRAAAGDEAVLASEAERGAYARDLWPKLTVGFRDGTLATPPAAVVRPADEDAVLRVLRVAARHSVPLVAFGAGSGVCGGAAPLRGGVVVDLKRLDALGEVDAAGLQVTVGPGLMLQELEERLNLRGYTLGHFPSSIWCCTVGGCVAARGAGQLSSRYGKIEDMVTGLRVATPGQGLLGTGSLRERPSEPDWTPLFVGCEGTLGLITAVRLRVHPLPAALALRGVRFPSVGAGLSAFREILQSGLRPSVMRLYDPLDTWMAMQKANDPGDARRPLPGGGTPLRGGERPRRPPNAAAPRDGNPTRSDTPRVLGSVVSPGTLTDDALRGARRGRSLLRRAFGRGGGKDGGLLSAVTDRLVGDQLKHLLKPENLPLEKMLANPALLNRSIDLLPERCLAIFGAEGEQHVADDAVRAVLAACSRLGGQDLGPGPGERWFRTRYHVSFKLPRFMQRGGFADTFETAAPWSRVEALYEAVRAAVAPHALVMAHMSHAYHEGCSIYFTLVGYGTTPGRTEEVYRRTWDAAMDAALSVGATLTHHHGVGVLKKAFMDREHGDARALFEAARRAADPDRLLNPGKLFPDELPAPGPKALPPEPRALRVHAHEDGVVEAGVDWPGVELAAELSLRGHFLPPLGRDFLESTVGEWLGSGAVEAHHAVHGAWEHPLLALEGRLPDGRAFRSGRLPRSAAGPGYLPFGLGAGSLPTRPALATLRTWTPPSVRMVGFRFDRFEAAVRALRGALRGRPRPLDGLVFPGADPAGFREVSARPGSPRDGGLVYLALVDADGHPQATQPTVDALARAGGEPVSDQDALDWWEDQWAWPAREGAAAMERCGPRGDPGELGRGAAVVPWGTALPLLHAIGTLVGGPTRAACWFDAPLETGCTLRFRVVGSRSGQDAYALLHHQVRETIRAHGAFPVGLRFARMEPLPEEAFGGRGTPLEDAPAEGGAAALTRAVAEALGGSP